MQELPVYGDRGQSQGLALSEKRDRLLGVGEQKTEKLKSALHELTEKCVAETLRLTGVAVTAKDVTQAFLHRKISRPEPHEIITKQFEALQALENAARSALRVDRTLLCETHRLACPPGGGIIRTRPVRHQFEEVEASRPEFIADKLDNLSEWLDSDSVNSMLPPEKATLAFIRLLEIAPFERGNFRLAHLLLSYFAYRDRFPPLFLRADDIAEIRREIAQALKFETKSLVDRLTNAQLASLEHCLKAVA
jgi:hypothetical protein